MAKKAVLIGCNYQGTKAELKGCINDVNRMYTCLVDRYGFSADDIQVLIDTDDSYTQPTGKNISRAITQLIRSADSGDVLFVHYSGHGMRLPAETGDDDDTGYVECIVPTDMNLITDDDFRQFVDQLPAGCRLTIVSDSCHSGGLIDQSSEQIGESHKGQEHESSSGFGIKNFLKQRAGDALESRGIHVPSSFRRHGHHEEESEDREIDIGDGEGGYVKSRDLPLSTLIEILKQKTGKSDIDVGKLRPTLFDVFGEDASPKVKKFRKVILNEPQNHEGEGSGGLFGKRGGLAQEFLKQKLEDNDEYAKPALDTEIGSNEEVYAGASHHAIPDGGILISGCQGKLRPTLFDVFGEDASPKVKKFMKVILNELQNHEGEGSGGLFGKIGGLAQEFLKQKLEDNDEYAKPALDTEIGSNEEVYAGASHRAIPDGGILISGCQTDQTSADASPSGNAAQAYGALSNAIQTILAESDGEITNHDLVLRAREILKKQGFAQRPGLYCSDHHNDAPFVC